MRKNDAGLTILEKGDVVRIGKGKVLYTVLSDVVTAEADIESQNTGKAQTVETARLNLVESVQARQDEIEDHFVSVEQADHDAEDLTFDDVLSHSATPGINADQARVEALGAKLDPRTTSYGKAVLFALNKLGKHVYAGTVSKAKKARTRKLNLRQKASRKANR